MASKPPGGVTVTALTHDLAHSRSLVSLVWDSDPQKHVVLPVPFGCSLADIGAEAEKALRGLSAETAILAVKVAN